MLEESRAQVAHIARVATLGELAAAASHELRQPLTAIRANATAGARRLDQSPPNLSEAREIFRDIENDDMRATEVLEDIRAMDAVQASQPSGRGQEVVVGTSAAAGSVEVFVRDTGPGLSAEMQQRIFEPFYSTKSHGLGMGLAIVRSIVERHGGRVRAENHDGRGAVFRVQLPVEA